MVHGSRYASKDFVVCVETGCRAIGGGGWRERDQYPGRVVQCGAQTGNPARAMPAGNLPGRQGWWYSGGSPATTLDDGTRTATISALPTTKPLTHPIACSKLRNHRPRVQLPGSRPVFRVYLVKGVSAHSFGVLFGARERRRRWPEGGRT